MNYNIEQTVKLINKFVETKKIDAKVKYQLNKDLLNLFLAAYDKIGNTEYVSALKQLGADKALKLDILPNIGHGIFVNSVAFSPDGKYIASGGGNDIIKLWDIESGKCFKILEEDKCAPVSSFLKKDFSSMTLGGNFNSVQFFDPFKKDNFFSTPSLFNQTEKTLPLGTNTTTWGGFNSQRFNPFEKDRSSSQSFSSRYKRRHNGDDCLKNLWSFQGFSVSSVAFSPDGKYLVTGNSDTFVKLWDIKKGECIEILEGHTDIVTCVFFSADGKYILSGSRDGTIKMWKGVEPGMFDFYPLGFCLRTFYIEGGVFSFDVSFNEKYLVVGTCNGKVKFFDLNMGKCIKSFEEQALHSSPVCFSPDGEYIASGNLNTIKLWDVETGKCIHTFEGHEKWVYSLSFNPDGNHLASGAWDGSVKVWDISSKKCIKTFKEGNGWIMSITFSSDGKSILSGGSKGKVRLWNLVSGKSSSISGKDLSFSVSVSCSPDGRYIVSGNEDCTIRIWDLEHGKQIKVFQGHKKTVYCVRFTSDGKYIVSGSYDKTIKLWDIETGTCVNTFEYDKNNFNGSTPFSPDGRYMILVTKDEKIEFFDTYLEEKIFTFEEEISGLNSFAVNYATSAYMTSAGVTGTILICKPQKAIAQLISFNDGEWVIITSKGYYACSKNGEKHINFVINNKPYPAEIFRPILYRENLNILNSDLE